MCHILETTLMTEKSKSILVNCLKTLIRSVFSRDLPGVRVGIQIFLGCHSLLRWREKKCIAPSDSECKPAVLSLTPEYSCLGTK